WAANEKKNASEATPLRTPSTVARYVRVAVYAALLPLLLAIGSDTLGPPIHPESFVLRPPSAFRMARMDLFHSSRVGSVARADESPRRLLAALVDTDGEDSAALLLSAVDEPFKVSTGARDELSAQVAKHFNNELGLKFALEKAEVVPGASPRVEVLGSVREG